MFPSSDYARVDGLNIEESWPGDLGGIDSELTQLAPEIEKAKSARQKSSERFTFLGEAVRELDAKHTEAATKRDQEFNTGLDEVIENPASASRDLAMQWLPLEREARFLQDALDRLRYVLLPAALEDKLSTRLDLLRLESVEAALLAARRHAQDQQQLRYAGFGESNPIVYVSQITANLRAAAREAHRQAGLAADSGDSEHHSGGKPNRIPGRSRTPFGA